VSAAICPHCKGTRVEFNFLPDTAGRHHRHESRCSRCLGTGRVDPVEDAVLTERLREADIRAAKRFTPREARS
jgi:hypothetical protein